MSKREEEEPRARSGPIEVFYSYAPADDALRKELDKHLAVLKQRGVIDAWHAQRIAAGQDWRDAVHARLEAARVVLLLVSADFLASNHCSDVEMNRALERHDAGEVLVIPILLRACDWREAPFARLRPLPGNETPVTSWENHDEAWESVAVGIRDALDALVRGDPTGWQGERDDDLLREERARLVRLRGGGRFDGFLVRVESIARLREPGALAVRRRALPPFAGLLEVAVREGALVDVRVIGAPDHPVTEELVAEYATQLERRYRQEGLPAVSTLVHAGPQASIELARKARRKGIVLRSFAEYQGLIDFSGAQRLRSRRRSSGMRSDFARLMGWSSSENTAMSISSEVSSASPIAIDSSSLMARSASIRSRSHSRS